MPRESGEGEFSMLAQHEYINLVTFRPDSSAVHTTVRFVVIGDYVYIQSPRRSGKIRRIEATGRVLIAPSNSEGAPLGRSCLGLGRTIEGKDAETATRALEEKYGQAHADFLLALGEEEEGWETIEIRPWDE